MGIFRTPSFLAQVFVNVRVGHNFSLYANDLEQEFYLMGLNAIDVDMFKLFILLNANDISVLSETKDDLQLGPNVMYEYCNKWKFTVNTAKTKVIMNLNLNLNLT
jgi:hypothetical protein